MGFFNRKKVVENVGPTPVIRTNRSLNEINNRFNEDLLQEIKRRNDNVVVMDVGCGPCATCLNEILGLCPNVNGIGLDFKFD